MAALLNPRLWLYLAGACAIAFVLAFTYRAGKANVRADFDAYKLAQSAAMQKAQADARDKELALQDAANQTQKAKDEQIRNINRKLVAALGELRNRPQRPAVLPENSSACRSGTGAGIYAEDAAVVIGEAARADRLRASLAACYSQYRALTIK